jgi:hypothetical protein
VGGSTKKRIPPKFHCGVLWAAHPPTAARRLHTRPCPSPLCSAFPRTYRRRIHPRHHDADAPAARLACYEHTRARIGGGGRRRCESARAANSISLQVQAIYKHQHTADIYGDTSFKEEIMKTVIQTHKEGKYFVATDLVISKGS